MVASFMNPHDVCEWIRAHPGTREHADLRSYPPAPANMAVDPHEPECMQLHRFERIDKMSEGVAIASEWRRDDFRHYLHDYYRMVESVDREIGRVLQALEETGLRNRTVVAVCSDHGEGMGAHRWVQKAAFWEETVHVPLMIAGPGIRPAHVHRGLTSLADLLPTFCELAGINAPTGMRGVSLRPALSGGTMTRPFVVSELRYRDAQHEGRMVRSSRYKYVVFNSGARAEQLFDLELDPGETINQVGTSAHIVGEHREILRRWMEETGDRFVPAVKV
jgi:arylsulfatase A-like enzyme